MALVNDVFAPTARAAKDSLPSQPQIPAGIRGSSDRHHIWGRHPGLSPSTNQVQLETHPLLGDEHRLPLYFPAAQKSP